MQMESLAGKEHQQRGRQVREQIRRALGLSAWPAVAPAAPATPASDEWPQGGRAVTCPGPSPTASVQTRGSSWTSQATGNFAGQLAGLSNNVYTRKEGRGAVQSAGAKGQDH